MGKKKACFGDRHIVCVCVGCPYFLPCVQTIAEQRRTEQHADLVANPRVSLARLKKLGRRRTKLAGRKL